MTPFYGRLPNVAGFGIESKVDVIGAALAIGATAGVIAHAAATGIYQMRRRKAEAASTTAPAKDTTTDKTEG